MSQPLGLKLEHFDPSKIAFLEALREAGTDNDYSRDACRAILGPALTLFMRENSCGER